MSEGFEALADAVLLFLVLSLAIGAGVAWMWPPPVDGEAGAAYAEDVRLALFRTPLDGLRYVANDTVVSLPNGTSVETLLRIEVHVLDRTPLADFSDAHARVAALARSVLRPGWGFAVVGGDVGRPHAVQIPETDVPATRFESAWTYPAIDGAGPDVRLALALWLNPR